MVWLVLVCAVLAEVIATTALKLSDGLTRLVPSVIVGVGYIATFVLLSIVLRKLDVSVAYAVWSGVGTAAIAVVGMVALGEAVTPGRIGGILLIIAGAVTLNLAGGH